MLLLRIDRELPGRPKLGDLAGTHAYVAPLIKPAARVEHVHVAQQHLHRLLSRVHEDLGAHHASWRGSSAATVERSRPAGAEEGPPRPASSS